MSTPSEAERRPRVLIVAPHFFPAFRAGGPVRTLKGMVQTHGDRFDFFVLTSDTDFGQSTPMEVPRRQWIRHGACQVRYIPRSPVTVTRELVKAFRSVRPDLLYLNSLLHPRMAILPLLLHRLGLLDAPVLLAPRGELSAEMLRIKRLKKWTYLHFGARVLTRGVAWHATTENEARDIHRVFPEAPIHVRPNETSLPTKAAPPLRGPGSDPRAPLRAVMVSRLSSNKGLHTLLQALAHTKDRVVLDVYGAFEDDKYSTECLRLAAAAAHHEITFKGPVAHDQVGAIFRRADVFLFPTVSENFGHVVSESLAQSCPVVIADVTPWTPWIRAGGGVLLPSLAVEHWTTAISRLAREDAETRWCRRQRAGETFASWRAREPPYAVFDLFLTAPAHGGPIHQ